MKERGKMIARKEVRITAHMIAGMLFAIATAGAALLGQVHWGLYIVGIVALYWFGTVLVHGIDQLCNGIYIKPFLVFFTFGLIIGIVFGRPSTYARLLSFVQERNGIVLAFVVAFCVLFFCNLLIPQYRKHVFDWGEGIIQLWASLAGTAFLMLPFALVELVGKDPFEYQNVLTTALRGIQQYGNSTGEMLFSWLPLFLWTMTAWTVVSIVFRVLAWALSPSNSPN